MLERIKTIIAHYKLSNRAFAIKCGLKDNTLTNQLNGIRELSLQTVNAILISFEGISSEWLLRGEGNMFLSKKMEDNTTEKRMNSLIDAIGTLQETINEKSKSIQLLIKENKKQKDELATLKMKVKSDNTTY